MCFESNDGYDRCVSAENIPRLDSSLFALISERAVDSLKSLVSVCLV